MITDFNEFAEKWISNVINSEHDRLIKIARERLEKEGGNINDYLQIPTDDFFKMTDLLGEIENDIVKRLNGINGIIKISILNNIGELIDDYFVQLGMRLQ